MAYGEGVLLSGSKFGFNSFLKKYDPASNIQNVSCFRNILKLWDPRAAHSIKTLKLSKDLQGFLYHEQTRSFVTATGKVWLVRPLSYVCPSHAVIESEDVGYA